MRCIEDGFIRHAPMFRILEHLGLDQAGMLRTIRENLKQK